MTKKTDDKASEVYFKPRDRFYEFLEQHEVLGKERKKAERRGAVYMTVFLCLLIALAFATHEDGEYSLITKIFQS